MYKRCLGFIVEKAKDLFKICRDIRKRDAKLRVRKFDSSVRLSVCLQMIRRCYKQFGLERSPQVLPKAGYKFRIPVRYDPVRTAPIAQQKLSAKYVGSVFYGVSFVSG